MAGGRRPCGRVWAFNLVTEFPGGWVQYMHKVTQGVTAYQLNRWLGGNNRSGLAFGSRYNPGTPSLIGFPKWPPCSGCCLAQHSNFALGHGPELRIPALLRCGEAKGHSKQCGRTWLHAHENHHKVKSWIRTNQSSSACHEVCSVMTIGVGEGNVVDRGRDTIRCS
jgi:hypothetical protein